MEVKTIGCGLLGKIIVTSNLKEPGYFVKCKDDQIDELFYGTFNSNEKVNPEVMLSILYNNNYIENANLDSFVYLVYHMLQHRSNCFKKRRFYVAKLDNHGPEEFLRRVQKYSIYYPNMLMGRLIFKSARFRDGLEILFKRLLDFLHDYEQAYKFSTEILAKYNLEVTFNLSPFDKVNIVADVKNELHKYGFFPLVIDQSERVTPFKFFEILDKLYSGKFLSEIIASCKLYLNILQKIKLLPKLKEIKEQSVAIIFQPGSLAVQLNSSGLWNVKHIPKPMPEVYSNLLIGDLQQNAIEFDLSPKDSAEQLVKTIKFHIDILMNKC